MIIVVNVGHLLVVFGSRLRVLIGRLSIGGGHVAAPQSPLITCPRRSQRPNAHQHGHTQFKRVKHCIRFVAHTVLAP